ncbi:hypothetical protein GOV03_04415 [Candidatus Woesearchaeota archaeon]|nr:hypothetical protein [Candidatus Woesearchaeota archaeon]
MTKNIEYLICPEGHTVPCKHWDTPKKLPETDAMTQEPLFEPGTWCYKCQKVYGMGEFKK